jgi:hypothetical protein
VREEGKTTTYNVANPAIANVWRKVLQNVVIASVVSSTTCRNELSFCSNVDYVLFKCATKK